MHKKVASQASVFSAVPKERTVTQQQQVHRFGSEIGVAEQKTCSGGGGHGQAFRER